MAISYKPSGRYEPAAIWGLPVGMILTVALSGTLYNYLTFKPSIHSDYHNTVHLILGLICMLAAARLTALFKIRNITKAAALAALGTAIGWLAAWVILKYMAAPDESFFSFIYERFNEGVRSIPRHRYRGGPYQACGFVLMLGWLLEAAVIIGFAALGAKLQAKRPFSEKRSQWLRLQVKTPILTVYLPAKYHPMDQKHIIRNLSEGRMAYLKQFTVWKPPKISLFRRVPALTIIIMTDTWTPGGFLTLKFDDGKEKSSLLENAYINDQNIRAIFKYFSNSGRTGFLR